MSGRGDNIHKRSDGRWEGRYIKAGDAQGKAKYASVYAKTYAEIKQKLKSAASSQKTPSPEYMAFEKILWQWLDNKKFR